jgi:hypothetical protein
LEDATCNDFIKEATASSGDNDRLLLKLGVRLIIFEISGWLSWSASFIVVDAFGIGGS